MLRDPGSLVMVNVLHPESVAIPGKIRESVTLLLFYFLPIPPFVLPFYFVEILPNT